MEIVHDYGLDLPGTRIARAWRTRNAHVGKYSTTALMSIEDPVGAGNISDLIWWHPRRGNGELCHSFLGDGFYVYKKNRLTYTFKDIADLHNTIIDPSIYCGNCGWHIYLEIGFEDKAARKYEIIKAKNRGKRARKICVKCARVISVYPNGRIYKHACRVR